MSEMAYDFASHRIASQAYSNLFSMLEDQYVDDEKPSYQIRIRFFGAGVILCSGKD